MCWIPLCFHHHILPSCSSSYIISPNVFSQIFYYIEMKLITRNYFLPHSCVHVGCSFELFNLQFRCFFNLVMLIFTMFVSYFNSCNTMRTVLTETLLRLHSTLSWILLVLYCLLRLSLSIFHLSCLNFVRFRFIPLKILPVMANVFLDHVNRCLVICCWVIFTFLDFLYFQITLMIYF